MITESVDIPFVHDKADSTVFLRLSCLPSTGGAKHPIIDFSRVAGWSEADQVPYQIFEGSEYLFEIIGPSDLKVSNDCPEIIRPDGVDGRRGRLRTGQFTGTLQVNWNLGDEEFQTFLEVQSTKLGYLNHYRWMLRDIAELCSEVIMRHFAPSSHSFEPEDASSAETLYQRFCFLKSLISNENFDAAVQEIVRRPYRKTIQIQRTTRMGKGLKSSGMLARELQRAGPRIQSDKLKFLNISSLPESVRLNAPSETLDNPENQFVKYTFLKWRDVVSRIRDSLHDQKDNSVKNRGIKESEDLLQKIDSTLAQSLFKEVSDLSAFPSSSTVLQKRGGYRELFKAYVQFDAASKISWNRSPDNYQAGQKDVATLYEFWAYLELAKVLSSLCAEPLNLSSLIDSDELSLTLKRGKKACLVGIIDRAGRKLKLELFFNKTFNRSEDPQEGSWSLNLRPDCSLCISILNESYLQHKNVWLHFDSKYKIDSIESVLSNPDDKSELEGRGDAKVTDILKMHTYRDAIRRSAGSYVIYPGLAPKNPIRQYKEIVPGIGAFALLPTDSGVSEGVNVVKQFIDDVITNVAQQTSERERVSFWTEHARKPYRANDSLHASFLTKPPADTSVLFGFVKSEAHYNWIIKNKLYNLRGDDRRGSIKQSSRLLDADLVLLYGPDMDECQLWISNKNISTLSTEGMEALGYPTPNGKTYLCISLSEKVDVTLFPEMSAEIIQKMRIDQNVLELGAPFTTSWQEFSGIVRPGSTIPSSKATLDD